ncbi:hypothetical protein ACFFF5_11055 [Lederbergia wuyishanensis]|uniref:DUF4179 domain-containing protein n=1 Tax=Lederbergia wuyishanensis TaxID=1347903 RepID=A0ABU0D4C5_9BACI|nr:hypothetical protein [Lederbergia wuyishanensis]MCJ8008166.1 hypothetical protein [Lederbergia wuyishanensis]MDQ0343245.1 hypothetical protein [Lederbergia wuyishanensis]
MEKLQRDIKSMVDNVAIPTDKLNKTVHTAISHARKQKKHSLFNRQHVMVSIASTFVLVIAAILFATNYPKSSELAEGITSKQGIGHFSYTDSIFYAVGDDGLKRMAIEGKVKNLSLESEDQKIKVILKEGFLDSHQMALSYRIEFNDEVASALDNTTIETELLVDGISNGYSGFGGMKTKEISEKGDIFYFETSNGFPTNPELEIRIHSINEVEGNWSFTFNLQKEEEYLTKSNITSREDDSGNYFSVNNAYLTPSKLVLNTKTEITLKKAMPANSYLFMSVVALGPDGYIYLSDPLRQYSNDTSASYDPITNDRKINEFLEIPRGISTYSYKIVPYIATYKGEKVGEYEYKWNEITSPFSQGAILETDSRIKVAEIKNDTEETVVYYETDTLLPIFPKIIDRENDIMLDAISYKKDGKFIEVTYPKIDKPESMELLMYEATYKVFKDLEIGIDF